MEEDQGGRNGSTTRKSKKQAGGGRPDHIRARGGSMYRLVMDQQMGHCVPPSSVGGQYYYNNHRRRTAATQHNYRKECRELLVSSMMVAENIISGPGLQLQPQQQQPDPPGCLFCMRFSEDGNYLATTNTDTVNIWDPSSGMLLHTLKEHKEIVTSVAWFSSSYGSNGGIPPFFTCSLDKTIRLWMNYKPVAVYTDHKGSILFNAAYSIFFIFLFTPLSPNY